MESETEKAATRERYRIQHNTRAKVGLVTPGRCLEEGRKVRPFLVGIAIQLS